MNERMIETTVPQPDVATMPEFDWLMSLALDDLLDDEDRDRFDALLLEYPALADEWAAWQFIDAELELTPAVVPASGFVGRFEVQLARYEQERQRRVVLLTTALAVVAGAIVFAGTAGMGAFVFLTQGQWIGEQMRGLTMAYTSLNLWLDSAVATAAVLVNTPQALAVGFGYAAAMVAMLAGWIYLLRRSARLDGAPASMRTE